MSIEGTALLHPIRADRRGTLACTASRAEMIEQSIRAILETRQGERVMLPDYGMPDVIFDVVDAGFAARFAFFAEQQIARYEPLVARVRVRVGVSDGGSFLPGFSTDQHRVAVLIEYSERGSNSPRNLVYPIWDLRPDLLGINAL